MKKLFKITALILAVVLLTGTVAFAADSYTVESGDSLWTIANKFGISVDDLMSANSMTSENIQIGQVLKIPGATSSQGGTTVEIPDDAPVGNGYDIPTLSVDFIDAISFQVVDTDIRDILNIIANYAGKKIIYLGEPQTISVTCSLVSSMKAISLVVDAAEGLSYVSDNSFIIVGPESRISSVMMYSDMKKQLTLKNMTASDFVAVLEKLGIETDGLTADEKDPNKISVTAKPLDLARVVTTQYMLDKSVNFPLDELAQTKLLNMKQYKLEHVGREVVEAFGQALGLKLTYLPNYADDSLYIAGSTGAIADLDALMSRIDTPENFSADTRLTVYAYSVASLPRDEFVEQMSQFASTMYVTREGNKKIVYFIGTVDEVDSAVQYAEQIDKTE